MARRYLEDSFVECAHLMAADFERVGDGLSIPASGHARGKECFHFRGEVESPAMEGIVEGLNAEAIAGSEDSSVEFIPQHKSELAAQPMEAFRAEIFVEVESNFTVRPGTKAMACSFELLLDGFVAIELAVDHDPGALTFTGDRLVAGGEIDDAEPRMP